MAPRDADGLTIRVTTFSLLLSETHISNITLSRAQSLIFICMSMYLSSSISLHQSPQGHLKRCLDLFYHTDDSPLLFY